MSTITIEVQDNSKRALLIALLAELDFVRVIDPETPVATTGVMTVEEPDGPPWSGHELALKPARAFAEVVREQGNKKLAFSEIAGSWAGAGDDVSLAELLAAVNRASPAVI